MRTIYKIFGLYILFSVLIVTKSAAADTLGLKESAAESKENGLDLGIFGEFDAKPELLDDHATLFTGSRIGVIFDFNITKLAVSVALNQIALTNYEKHFTDTRIEKPPSLSMYYYGLDLEYYLVDLENWAYSIGVTGGPGELTYEVTLYNAQDSSSSTASKRNNFMFIEPRFTLSLKAKTYYHFVFSAGYRMVFCDPFAPFGSESALTQQQLSTPVISIGLQFGSLF